MPGFVTVACNLPNGLILRGERKEVVQELIMGGHTRETVYWRDTGIRITINGNRAPHGKELLDASGNHVFLANGYALTTGVPEDFWEAWYERHKDAPYCRCMSIYAAAKTQDVRAIAKENAERRSGLEPMPQIDADSGAIKDPRVQSMRRQGKRGAGVSGIAPSQAGA